METNKKIRPASEIMTDILTIVKNKSIEQEGGLHHNTISSIKLKKSIPRRDKLIKITKALETVRDRLNKLIEEYKETVETLDKIREG